MTVLRKNDLEQSHAIIFLKIVLKHLLQYILPKIFLVSFILK